MPGYPPPGVGKKKLVWVADLTPFLGLRIFCAFLCIFFLNILALLDKEIEEKYRCAEDKEKSKHPEGPMRNGKVATSKALSTSQIRGRVPCFGPSASSFAVSRQWRPSIKRSSCNHAHSSHSVAFQIQPVAGAAENNETNPQH